MYGSGLFCSENDDSINHAMKIISFWYEYLQAIQKINQNLDTTLQVGVSFNNGSSNLSEVLVIRRPTFDIIGNIINISAKFQSTDIRRNIHISKATFDLIIQNQKFEI
jgi:hypothetical protein